MCFHLPLMEYIKSRLKKIVNVFLLFVASVNNNIRKAIKDYEKIKLAHRNLYQLNCYIKAHKNHTSYLEQKNVEYIPCNNCDSTYVGQTSRQLNTRLKEHQRNVLNNKRHLDFGGAFSWHNSHLDWDNTKVLDIVPMYNKRLTSEMLHIKLQKENINIIKDTESLDNMYLSVIKRLKH